MKFLKVDILEKQIFLLFSGPRSTPFFNDSCSDNEGTTDEAILQSSTNNNFIHIKEELENEGPFFKSNSNMPLHVFTGK